MTGSRLLGRLVSDSALYGLSAAIAKALALLTVPFLTRALAPSGYGVADLATSTSALLTLLALFAGDIPAAREYGRSPSAERQQRILSSYVWAAAAVGLMLVSALLPFSGILAGTIWGRSNAAGLAVLALILVPVSAVQAALVQTQRIRARPVLFATLSIVDLLAQLGLAVAFVALGFGPAGVLLGFVVGSVVGLVAAAFAATDTLRARPDAGLATHLFLSGTRFLPNITFFVMADWIVRSITANALGAGQVAQLGLAIRVASVLSLVGTAFALAWGPTGLARVGNLETAKIFGRLLLGFGGLAVAIAVVLAAVGPEILPLIAGPRYDDASLILPGVALAAGVAGTEYILVVTAGISNRASRVGIAATIGAVAQIGMAFQLIPAIGVFAIGPAAIFGRMVSFGILLSGVRHSLAFPWGRLYALGLVSVVSALGLEALVSVGPTGRLLRWALALAVVGWASYVAARLRRDARP
jgi:O-antigen/teichoic acid export membrane protein